MFSNYLVVSCLRLSIYAVLFQESSSNTTVNVEFSDTKLTENPEKDPSVISVPEKDSKTTADQEKDRLTPSNITGDNTPEEKVSDLSVDEGSKANEDTHSDPETGEFDDSFLPSIKEPNTDVNDMVPSAENISETDSTLEVRGH